MSERIHDQRPLKGAAQAAPTRRQFLKGAATAGTSLLALGGTSFLLSCGGSNTPSTSQGGRTGSNHLRVIVPGSAQDLPVWQQFATSFQKTHPKVTIDFTFFDTSGGWGGFFSTVEERLAGGATYDLISVPTEGQRLFASKGVLEPIDKYLDRDKNEIDPILKDIDANFLKEIKKHTATKSGQTYFLPYAMNTMCMWYNKPLFDAAGVPHPTNEWTWNDFVSAAERIATPNAEPGKQVYGYYLGFGSIFDTVDSWLFTNGAHLLNDSWTAPTIDSAAAIESLQFMRDLVARKLAPMPGGQFDPVSAAIQGRLAMFGCGWWFVPRFVQQHYIANVGMAPWPKNTRHGSPGSCGAIAMFKQAQNKDLGWELIKSTVSLPVQSQMVQTGLMGSQAIRRSVATGPVSKAAGLDGYANEYEALSYSTYNEGIDQFNAFSTAVLNSFQQAVLGNVSPSAALKQLNETMKPLLS